MIMKKNSGKNTRKKERELCVITLIMKKRTFKKRGQQKRKRKVRQPR